MNISSSQLFQVREAAIGLMKQHGLADWDFGFDRAVGRTGQCKYPNKWRGTPGRISLSRFYAGNPATQNEFILDTILHEIAHALTPGAGHGPEWQAKCREIGARPVRCGGDKVAERVPYKWEAVCGGCSHLFGMHRNKLGKRKSYCPPCGPERGLLSFKCVR